MGFDGSADSIDAIDFIDSYPEKLDIYGKVGRLWTGNLGIDAKQEDNVQSLDIRRYRLILSLLHLKSNAVRRYE
jgi:hypothetical protein